MFYPEEQLYAEIKFETANEQSSEQNHDTFKGAVYKIKGVPPKTFQETILNE